MNMSDPRIDRDAASSRLPELSTERIDEIETALFADIATERTTTRKRRTRRRRIWTGVGAAAAIVTVAAVISPMVLSSITGSAGSDGEYVTAEDSGAAGDYAAPAPLIQGEELATDAAGGSSDTIAPRLAEDRDVIATASATVTVDSIPNGLQAITDAATAAGGFVESMSTDETGAPAPLEGESYDTSMPYYPSGSWITVRVPSDELTDLIEKLSDVGEVTASSINRQDVTEQAIDLRARVEATQASVDRMTDLMSQAGSLTDLIAAETALSERQANLESYQQQLTYLEKQVAMSTLTVTVTRPYTPVEADPAGFGDGLAAGWNAFIATANGIVISLGFLIPWVVVLGVIALIVWGIVRLVRRGRGRAAAEG